MEASRERVVIVGYKPLPGKEDQLRELLKDHVEALRKEGLASDRAPVLLAASDGTLIEIFGWKSKEAIEQAHSNPIVQELWGEFESVCHYVPAGALEEMKGIFSEFLPVS